LKTSGELLIDLEADPAVRAIVISELRIMDRQDWLALVTDAFVDPDPGLKDDQVEGHCHDRILHEGTGRPPCFRPVLDPCTVGQSVPSEPQIS
jgi:hypothetical protein